MKFTMRHPIDTDAATFWPKLFFDDDFNRRMFREGLEARLYEVLERVDEPSGNIKRKVKILPKDDPPAPVKKLLGEPVSVEEGTFDAAAGRWSFRITPPSLVDKIKISGDITLAPAGEKRVDRVTTVEIKVDVFGIGGLIEGFIEKTMRDSYDRSARFINRHLADKR